MRYEKHNIKKHDSLKGDPPMKHVQNSPQDDDGYGIPVLLLRHAQKSRRQAATTRRESA